MKSYRLDNTLGNWLYTPAKPLSWYVPSATCFFSLAVGVKKSLRSQSKKVTKPNCRKRLRILCPEIYHKYCNRADIDCFCQTNLSSSSIAIPFAHWPFHMPPRLTNNWLSHILQNNSNMPCSQVRKVGRNTLFVRCLPTTSV
jgi:hypothetical protein